MADYTALFEAGSGLVELLRDNLTPEPIGKRELIALCSPHESENNQLTVYLYHVEEDGQNGRSGYQPAGRNLERMPATNLTGSFLVTAHSKAPVQLREADQYRIMGAAIQTIKDMPILDKRYLTGSLAQSGAELHLMVERPNFEQMMKIWNDSKTPYKLSIVVKVTGIAIDSRRTRRIGRVADVEIHVDQRRQS